MYPEWLFLFTRRDYLIRFFSILIGAGILILGDGYVLVRLARGVGVYLALALQGVVTLIAVLIVGNTIRVLIRYIRQDARNGSFREKRYATLVAVIVAGILLVIPGFITDVCGLLLYLPPGRQVFALLFARYHHDSLAMVNEYLTLELFSPSAQREAGARQG